MVFENLSNQPYCLWLVSLYQVYLVCMIHDNCLVLVLFIISLSDYNQVLYEDETTNRMQESERLFGKKIVEIICLTWTFSIFKDKCWTWSSWSTLHSLSSLTKWICSKRSSRFILWPKRTRTTLDHKTMKRLCKLNKIKLLHSQARNWERNFITFREIHYTEFSKF